MIVEIPGQGADGRCVSLPHSGYQCYRSYSLIGISEMETDASNSADKYFTIMLIICIVVYIRTFINCVVIGDIRIAMALQLVRLIVI